MLRNKGRTSSAKSKAQPNGNGISGRCIAFIELAVYQLFFKALEGHRVAYHCYSSTREGQASKPNLYRDYTATRACLGFIGH